MRPVIDGTWSYLALTLALDAATAVITLLLLAILGVER